MSRIAVKNLNKYYGKFQALKNIDLQLGQGKIIGLLGKNGAGKSTLMRCLLGMLKFQGEISIDGTPVNNNREQLCKHIAFIPDVGALDNRLTVSQAIKFIANTNPAWNDRKAGELLQKSKLPLDVHIDKLSKGMKTKLYLLLTLSLDVDILILDEPTLGLDIVFRKEFFNTILGEFYDEQKTIIISTHQVEEVEHILEEIIFIDEGKICLHKPIEELKNKYNIVTVASHQKEELLRENPQLISHSLGHISGLLPADALIPDASYERPMLSDIFLATVGGSDETV